MPGISGTTKIFINTGTINTTKISSNQSVSNTTKISQHDSVSFPYRYNVFEGSLSNTCLILKSEGIDGYLKIDCISNTTDIEYNFLAYSSQLEFSFKEFVRKSGQIGRGNSDYSDYYLNDVSSFVKIFPYRKYQNDLISLDIFKYPSRKTRTGLSSSCVISKHDPNEIDANETPMSASVVINAIDDTPFSVIDIIPPPNSFLNPRDTPIEFTLLDESTGILVGELDIVIEGDNVITNGVNTATLGDVDVQVLSPPNNRIKITYQRYISFDLGQEVNVSIVGKDLATPLANTTNYGYSFRVWSEGDLYGEINALPDENPPYLSNLSPASGATLVNPCADVYLEILDDLTGLDYDSLFLSFDGETFINHGEFLISESNIETTPINNFTGIAITYSPPDCLEWDTEYTVVVSGRDRYKPSYNNFEYTYSFTTIPNDSIVIDNFFLEEIDDSLVVDSNTLLSVDVKDASYGIDITRTKLFYFGEEVVFSSSVITDGYRITYQPPDLFSNTEVIEILVHAVNNRSLDFEVFKEREYIISSGYRIEAVPDEKYDYSSYVYPVVSAKNTGRNPELTTDVFKFRIHDISNKDLYGYIVSNKEKSDLNGYIRPIAPLAYYNKVMTVRVEASDLEGNAMSPFEFSYRIERKPTEEG